MQESIMMMLMWLMGLFGGMIYKHFQVNKLRGEVKYHKDLSEQYRLQSENSDVWLENEIDKYTSFLRREYNVEVMFTNYGYRVTELGDKEKGEK